MLSEGGARCLECEGGPGWRLAHTADTATHRKELFGVSLRRSADPARLSMSSARFLDRVGLSAGIEET